MHPLYESVREFIQSCIQKISIILLRLREYFRNTYHHVIAVALIVALVASCFALYPSPVLGATYTFDQINWTTQTADVATHANNQSGWNKYTSTSNIATSSGVKLAFNPTISVSGLTNVTASSTLASGGPVIAISPITGVIYIAYYSKEYSANTNNFELRTSADNFASVTHLTAQTGTNIIPAQTPSMAIDSSGVVHLTYYSNEYNATYTNIVYRNSTNWANRIDISTSTTKNMTGPLIGVSPTNVVSIAYLSNEFAPNTQNIAYRNSTNWANRVDVTTSAEYPSNLFMAVDSSGVVHLVYQSQIYNGTTPNIVYRNSTNWANRVDVTTGTRTVGFPKIAVDSSGVVHLVTHSLEYNLTHYNIAYRNSTNWANRVDVTTNTNDVTGDASTAPSIVVDSSGVVHVVYTSNEYNSNYNNIVYRNSKNWATKTDVTTSSSASAAFGARNAFVIDPLGKLHVAYYSREFSALKDNIAYRNITPSGYYSSGNLISSIYDASDPSNIINSIIWNEDNTLPTGTTATVSIRTAATPEGIPSASWVDFTDVTAGCTKVNTTVTCPASTIPASMKDGSGDRYIQYKITLTSTGLNTPTISEFRLQYVVNAPPEFNSSYGTNGIHVSQVSDNTDPNYGKVKIEYQVRDPDTLSGTNTPGFVSPSFEYNTGSGWISIPSGYLSSGALNNVSVSQTDFRDYVVYWNAVGQIPGVFASSTQIRVTINDNEVAQNITKAMSNSIMVDTKNPIITAFVGDASVGSIHFAGSDDSGFSYMVSNNADMSADGLNASSGQWQVVSASSTDVSFSWNFVGTPSFESVYLKTRDAVGNIATSTLTIPSVPTNFDLKDLSNPQTGAYREFISWQVYATATSSPFAKYEVYRSTPDTGYTLIGISTDPAINYYFDNTVASSTTYNYKVRTVNTNGDASSYSPIVSDMPNGQGGTDFTPPVISAVTVTPIQATWATMSWTTDELSDSTVQYAPSSNNTSWQTVNIPSMTTSHQVTISNLKPNTQYIARVKSKDPMNNEATDDNSGSYYLVNTAVGPAISNVVTTNINNLSAEVVWNTDKPSDSHIVYSTNLANLKNNINVFVAGSNSIITNSNGGMYLHRVTIPNLTQQTTYYYYVKSKSDTGDEVTDINGGSYYTFTTMYDSQPPVISNIVTPVLTSDTAVITWTTDEPSDSWVQFGENSGMYTGSSTPDTTLTTNHAATISGLSATTKYYYKITSADAQKNTAISNEQSLTTAEPGNPIVYFVAAGYNTVSNPILDIIPPTISNYGVSDITSFSATVQFTTDEDSVGFVTFGPPGGSTITAGDSNYSTTHQIKLNGLSPNTTYDVQLKAIDKAGNIGVNSPGTFKTLFVAEDYADIINTPDVVQLQNKLENLIEQTTPSLIPPFISNLTVGSTTENSAVVTWSTNIPAYSMLSYTADTNYKPGVYDGELSNIDTKQKNNSFTLLNLKPSSLYHIQAKSYVFQQAMRKSDDITFSTKAGLVTPEVVRVGNTDMEIRWSTDTETGSFVEYKDVKTGVIGRVGDRALLKNHDIQVQNLKTNTTYDVKVFGDDDYGNTIESSTIRVKTTEDTTPPVMSNEKIVNALLPSKTNSLQTVISWTTDEPSNTEVDYEEGVGNALATLANKMSKDTEFTTEHVIILTTLKPGTVYRIQMKSADQAGNIASTTVRTILTPSQTESIVDIMIKNFEKSFGFTQSGK